MSIQEQQPEPFTTISPTELEDVNGGLLNKILLPIQLGFGLYHGIKGTIDSRNRGNSVGKSILDGLQNVGSKLTWGLIPEPR